MWNKGDKGNEIVSYLHLVWSGATVGRVEKIPREMLGEKALKSTIFFNGFENGGRGDSEGGERWNE